MPRIQRSIDNDESGWDVIPFPTQQRASSTPEPSKSSESIQWRDEGRRRTTDDVLAAFSTMSRRINDLARELKCLGYFDDDDADRPRAA